jgi:kinesin family member 2/24
MLSGSAQPQALTASRQERRHGAVRVCVRKRPIFEHERRAGEFDVLTASATGDGIVVHDARMHPDMLHLHMHHHRYMQQ